MRHDELAKNDLIHSTHFRLLISVLKKFVSAFLLILIITSEKISLSGGSSRPIPKSSLFSFLPEA